eukprot:TRINITY_DN22522_c0_g1_i1.p1 TRINITY_DN22522_c0_g1~~TRINITY_DN22522_c0_g1_i1.p1  ORF type:complete len:823 (+),score=195.20 TRINITY_DN22522_c0_g1_i1:98-2470(+)
MAAPGLVWAEPVQLSVPLRPGLSGRCAQCGIPCPCWDEGGPAVCAAAGLGTAAAAALRAAWPRSRGGPGAAVCGSPRCAAAHAACEADGPTVPNALAPDGSEHQGAAARAALRGRCAQCALPPQLAEGAVPLEALPAAVAAGLRADAATGSGGRLAAAVAAAASALPDAARAAPLLLCILPQRATELPHDCGAALSLQPATACAARPELLAALSAHRSDAPSVCLVRNAGGGAAPNAVNWLAAAEALAGRGCPGGGDCSWAMCAAERAAALGRAPVPVRLPCGCARCAAERELAASAAEAAQRILRRIRAPEPEAAAARRGAQGLAAAARERLASGAAPDEAAALLAAAVLQGARSAAGQQPAAGEGSAAAGAASLLAELCEGGALPIDSAAAEYPLLYAAAAWGGDAFAQYRLGAAALQGGGEGELQRWGLRGGAAEAAQWLSRAAAQRHGDAACLLAPLLLRGARGLPRDLARAARLLRRCGGEGAPDELQSLLQQCEAAAVAGAEWARQGHAITVWGAKEASAALRRACSVAPSVDPAWEAASPLPPMVLVTLTRNRPEVFAAAALPSARRQLYPPGLLRWVVMDDSDARRAAALRALLSDAPLGCRLVTAGGSIAQKRDAGCAEAECMLSEFSAAGRAGDGIIAMLDDDDLYHPYSSIVRAAAARASGGWAGCRSIANYCVPDGSGCVTSAPCPAEASLAFTSAFWRRRPFAAAAAASSETLRGWGEGAPFIAGREREGADLPWDWVIVSLVHGANVTGRAAELRRRWGPHPLLTGEPAGDAWAAG